jgi:hypothetical protein
MAKEIDYVELLKLAHEKLGSQSDMIAELDKLYAELYFHASALTFGTDWNKGTHALLHGHRKGLIDAVKALEVKEDEQY